MHSAQAFGNRSRSSLLVTNIRRQTVPRNALLFLETCLCSPVSYKSEPQQMRQCGNVGNGILLCK
ncbi:hypothetical protein E2C01_094903 [Portunus trituberculatus]|uniref:Uncharacterized protein n=1 Tax=Portunus trituberculatus TaxID=210409 RepID=A0A5B7K252_PORTR|nr:hypothetical protein [Portunus trituberculatus]